MTEESGSDAVRENFNSSGNPVVADIKRRTAELIDLCRTLEQRDCRRAHLAMDYYEQAAMWAVKAAT